MRIGLVYFKGNSVVLRDVDGSEVEISLDSAATLYVWLHHNMEEIERRDKEEQKASDDTIGSSNVK